MLHHCVGPYVHAGGGGLALLPVCLVVGTWGRVCLRTLHTRLERGLLKHCGYTVTVSGLVSVGVGANAGARARLFVSACVA